MEFESIGQNIRKYRIMRNLRQEDLAEKTDLSTNYIGALERCEKKPSLETRKKISIANKGKHHSEETKKKINNAKKGKHRSEETKKKLSKIILQFTLDGIFICEWPSINEAQSKLGIKHISDCCNGKRKSAGGFKWCYA